MGGSDSCSRLLHKVQPSSPCHGKQSKQKCSLRIWPAALTILLGMAALPLKVDGSTYSQTFKLWPQPWLGQRWPEFTSLAVSPATGHQASSGKVLDVSQSGHWILMASDSDICIVSIAGTFSQCYVAPYPIAAGFFLAEPAGCVACGISSMRVVALGDSGSAASTHWLHFDTNTFASQEHTLSALPGADLSVALHSESIALVDAGSATVSLVNNSAPWSSISQSAIPVTTTAGAVCRPSFTYMSILFSQKLSLLSTYAAVGYLSTQPNPFSGKVALNDMSPLVGCAYLNLESDSRLAIFGQMDGFLVVGWDILANSPRWTAALSVPHLSPDTHFTHAHNNSLMHMSSSQTAGAIYLEDRIGSLPVVRVKVTADVSDGWSATFAEVSFRQRSEAAITLVDILAMGVTADQWLLLEVLDSNSQRSLRAVPLAPNLRTLDRKTEGSSPLSATSTQGNTVLVYSMPAAAAIVAFHGDFILLEDASGLSKLALQLPSPTPSSSSTPSASTTPSRTPSASTTPSRSQTPSPSVTPSRSPSRTPSQSPSSSFTASPTRSQTRTPSRTPTASTTASTTPSSSITPTRTPSPSVTPTRTPSSSVTPTRTPSSSVTPTRTPSPSKSPTLIAGAADACRSNVQCDFRGFPLQFMESNVWCEDCVLQQGAPAPLLANSEGSSLLRCPRPGSCVQVALPSGQGAAVGCREGHDGPLCASCADGFFADDICGECKACQYGDWTRYIAVFVSAVAFIGVIVFSSFRAYKQAGKINVDLLTGTMRIMTQFLSIIGIAIAANTFDTIIPASASSQSLQLSTWSDVCGVAEIGSPSSAPAAADSASSATNNRWAFAQWGDQAQLIYGWEAVTNTFGRFVGASSVVRDGSLECLLPQNSFQLHAITGMVGIAILFVFCALLARIACLPPSRALRQQSRMASRQASRLQAEQSLSPEGSRLAAAALSISVVYYSLWNTVQTSNLVLLSKAQKLGEHQYWSASSYTWNDNDSSFAQMRAIALLGVILHGAVVPLGVFAVLMCFPDSAVLSSALKLSLSYLTGAYRRVTAWFEMVRLLERLLSFLALYLVFQKDQRTLLVVAANAATLLALVILKPYSLDELNNLDKLAHLGMFATSLGLAVIPPSFALYLVLLILNIGIGASIFSVWLRAASKSVRTKLAKINQFLRNKFPELGEEFAPPPTVEEVEYINAAPPSLRDWLRLLGRRAGCIGKPKRKKRIVYLQPAHTDRGSDEEDEFLPASACRDALCPPRAKREQPGQPAAPSPKATSAAHTQNPLTPVVTSPSTPSHGAKGAAASRAVRQANGSSGDAAGALATRQTDEGESDGQHSSSSSSPLIWHDEDLMAWEGVSVSVTMGNRGRDDTRVSTAKNASLPALLSPAAQGSSNASKSDIGSISNPMRASLTRGASFKRTFGNKQADVTGGASGDGRQARRTSGSSQKAHTPGAAAAGLTQNREGRARRNSNWLKQLQQHATVPVRPLAMPGGKRPGADQPKRGRAFGKKAQGSSS